MLRKLKPNIEEIKAELILHEAERKRRASEDLDVSDSAMSSWSEAATGRLLATQLSLAENNWMAWFPVLVDDATGVPLDAKQINGHYGLCWRIETGGKPTFVGVSPKALSKKGYRQEWALFPAHAKYHSSFVGDVGTVEIIRDSDNVRGGRTDKP